MIKISPAGFEGFDKLQGDFGQLRRLGIFDSGIGGLSLLKYLCVQLPDDKQITAKQITNKITKKNKEIIYVADSGRFPYGTKNQKEIFTYTQQIIHWLEQKKVDLIIFGCNTANAIVGEKLSQITQLPVVDLIGPVAKYVSTLGVNVGILATQATVSSHAFSKAIQTFAPELPVTEIAASELVNIVEKGNITSKETQRLLANYAQQFASEHVEIIVLGCTHFSFLKDYLLPYVDKSVQILDPAELIGQLITNCSQHDDQLTDSLLPKDSELTFFVTGDKEAFTKTATACLGYPLKNVNQLAISSLENS